ncbi:LCP family protein [Streptosporangium lutulentum]|uniref:LCP family protein required for cell wall assembly n=1 Tax=Streptosporangium lutulentum TaxID=1461250 RepID=A0ABT9QM31_9ACTN|nr:LCP family protein [Streptosporangium lutulentum]MDP9847816.1 LCP family protein required for cell wall assembly [Streptosporangium lutulentum]
MADWPEDDDRTRELRSPTPAPIAPRAAGQPAYPVPGRRVEPGREAEAGAARPRGSSRVYGKARSGSSPVKPLPSSPGDAPTAFMGGSSAAGSPAGSPGSFGGSSGGRGGLRAPSRGWRPKRPGRLIVRILIGLLVVLLVLAIGGYFVINSRLEKIPVLGDYEGRPADTAGTNWLLVGSDSREGLSKAQRKELATGSAVGRRTDTMMLLHIPDGDGRPTLVSLPRDSYVPIDGHGSDKLNAAYSFSDGGPKLLAKTVEQVTGLRLDHYMEIGFGGFVGIVDAIGGVEINVPQAIKDRKAGINLKKGPQVMDGGTALGYVRTRATGAIPDFDRTQRQRQFFSAVVKQAASPGVLINPFRSVPLALSATDSVSVGDESGAFDLLSLGLAMGGNPVTTVVPIGSLPTINGQAVVKWDTEKALRMFRALAQDKPVPKDVLPKK